MHNLCRSSGCGRNAASRFGAYCHSHRSRRRRHGAVDQEAITKADLKGYREIVRHRIAKNKDNATWDKLKAMWSSLIAEAQTVLADWRSGRAMPIFKKTTADELIKLSSAVRAEHVIETVLALYLLQDAEPRRIKSDAAFLTQMVRRVRGLTQLNAGTWTDGTGKAKSAYREVSPKVVECLGMKLARAFGPVGVIMAKLERRDHEAKVNDLAELREAVEGLK